MKKGFTLVELLVVVVVIITLMAIAFRISGAGSGAESRVKTVNRMQRLENCLSGYYAAYGSYPPVALHGRRDYRYAVNSSGVQILKDKNNGEIEWLRVRAACLSQPLAFACPYSSDVRGVFDQYSRNEDKFSGKPLMRSGEELGYEKRDETDWLRVQVCKLGVMSYLLPRLLVVLGDGDVSDSGFCDLLDYAQWSSNNEKPYDFASGQTYGSWKAANSAELFRKENRWKIALLPSQAVCARWIANLEEIVNGPGLSPLYGVDINVKGNAASPIYEVKVCEENSGTKKRTEWHRYSGHGQQGDDPSVGGYMLKEYSVVDGWSQDMYYYSPPPYQSYTLWSSGPNMRTFPPWITDEEIKKLDDEEQKLVQEWISDDIVHMKN